MMSQPQLDLLVIGSGAAGFAAAIRGRELGAHVAMVERATVGGTCVNVGCIPSKALLAAADHHHRAAHNPFAGLKTTTNGVDMPALVAQTDQLVAEMRRDKYEDLLDIYEIDLIRGEARFVGAEHVEVDGDRLNPDRVLITAGVSPLAPPIHGLADMPYLTSTTALELTEVPGDMVVIGAGAIGLELGQLFLHLGSRVTFVEILDRIAPVEEPEISAGLHSHLESLGARIVTSASVVNAGGDPGQMWLDLTIGEDTERVEAAQLLIATGRRPNTDGLDLAAAGVDIDSQGWIRVDNQMATTNPRVYAAGDVAGLPQYVYVAALSGTIAADNAIGREDRSIDLDIVPRVTFTSPQIASVGLTEIEARRAGHQVITSLLPLEILSRALVDHATTGLIKLVADQTSRRLLGAHFFAPGAGDVIQAAVMALRYQATIDEIADTLHPYLTMAEGFKLAVQGFDRDVTHLSCCAI